MRLLKNKNIFLRKISSLVLIFMFVLLSARFDLLTARAASLSGLSDTLSNTTVSAPSNHTIRFTTPSGVDAGETIIVTFPAGFDASSILFTDVDILDGASNLPVAASPSGATWGFVQTSSTVLTFTNGTTVIAPGQQITIKIGTNATLGGTGVNRVVNNSSNGLQTIGLSGTFGDTGNASVYLLTNGTVAVSATVEQSLTFSISSNSINFGTLSSAGARYANTSSGSNSDTVAHTLAIATNGSTGYTITVQGDTLISQQNPTDIIEAIGATPATSSPDSDQFGIYATKSGGVNGTIDSTFATASSFGYDATASTAASFATGSSATQTETYSLHYLANIASLTPAGTYSTSLTYVGTANF